MTDRRRSRGLSLRARLLLIASLLLAVGLTAGSAVVTGFLHGYLVSRIDAQLRPMATSAVQQVRSPESFARTIPVGEAGGFWDNYVALLGPDGELIAEQRYQEQPGPTDPALPRLDAAAVDAHGGRPFEVPSEDGSGSWRVLALTSASIAVGDESSVRVRRETVVVAASLDEVQATTARLNTISLATGAGLLVVLTVVGSFAIRGGLRPLRRIEQTLAGVAGGDLSQRVPGLAAPGTEIGRLSDALNDMLAQNEAAFAAKERSESRMRRFVADASHELRTPLVGIRGFTKLFRMGALTGQDDVERTMDRIERESLRLTRLVEDLLLLARLDEQRDPAESLELAQMDLRTVAADALHDVRALDPSRPVELTGPDGGTAAAAPALADEARMRQVVTNLVGNAVRHTPEGTRVRIGVGTADGQAVLEVADEGPGLTEEQRSRAFDRFYRADGSRSRTDGGGAGLGLAIAHSLVTAHGGTISLVSAPGAGAVFRVRLPLAGDATSPEEAV
ncbi:HAMP domain-containing histidine kinase [Saccharopolyspora indica]|uniref:sensor histidine kinase n=1 Tax=Saccharopolyspora indica TaxID=1229659 RepID=UPI0022EA12AC|nr:HAMP domain-containing sensor histidine kinase [Saccharopolyspora indica]MDA3647082.1 HAMP domain-containing sensor histidine kinase [Saccharopolyspora indica]